MKYSFFRETQIRQQIVKIGRLIWQHGFAAANDGNISVRLPDGNLLLTPTGVSKGFMKPSQLVKVNLDGQVISGRAKPSSEMLIHLEVYRMRPDIRAAIHAHPPYGATFAVAGEALTKNILPETIKFTGPIPLVPFGLPSTPELAEKLRPFLREYNLFLLEFHGTLTIGKNLIEAYHHLERLEYYAQILWNLKVAGIERELSPEQVARLNLLNQKKN